MLTTPRRSLLPAALALLCFQGCGPAPPQGTEPAQVTLEADRARYEELASSLNLQRFKDGYPALIESLDSEDPDQRIIALRTIGQSAETDAIPLVVQVVLSESDPGVRSWAGAALSDLVTSNELKRRDRQQPERVVLLARSEDDVDLRPLAWVLREMLARPDDTGLDGFAATMIGNLGLKEFEPELTRLLESRHPAVAVSAANALRMMGIAAEDPTFQSFFPGPTKYPSNPGVKGFKISDSAPELK